MSVQWGTNGSAAHVGTRRKAREQRERERKLTMRHRWYAGGIATILSGALIFSGVSPAMAEAPSPTPSESSTIEPTPPADETTPPSDETTPPADESTPPSDEVTTPPVDDTTAPPVDETTEPPVDETTEAPVAPQSRLAPQAETFETLAAGPAITCVPNTFYSMQNGGTVKQIANGAVTNFGTGWPGRSDVNGIAIGANGSEMYAYDRTGEDLQNISGILRYTPATNTWEELPNTAYDTHNSRSLVTGAVNLANGRYLFGGYDGESGNLLFRLYEYNPGNNQIVQVGYFDTGFDSGVTANGDMAFDSAGNLYIIRSGDMVNVYTVTAATLIAAAANPGNVMARSATDNMTLEDLTDVNGIAFNADGTVYLGNGSTAKKYNPTTWAKLEDTTGSLGNSTDLASCNSPANLTLKKDVVGRSATGDQFTIVVKSGQTQVATATTTGNSTGIQAQQIGPIPVLAGSTYAISEIAAAGGSLASYTTTWSCNNGQSGNGPSGSVTIPNTGGASVACTFSNTPLQGSLQINKVITGGGVASTTAFAIDYNCGSGFAGTANVTTAAGATISGIPTGRSCTVSENTGQLTADKLIDASFSWNIGASGVVAPLGAQVIVTGETKVFTVTNTTSRNSGNFSVDKSVSGTGAVLVPGTTAFIVHYEYPAGLGYPGGSGNISVTPDQGAVASVNIPTGAIVTLTEPNLPPVTDGTWGTPVFTPKTFTIGNATTVAVTLDNPITLDTGGFTVKKSVTGVVIPPSATFTVHWAYPANGTIYAAGSGELIVPNDGQPHAVNAIPIGAQVTLTETSHVDQPGFDWSANFTPSNVITINSKTTPVAVVLTNDYKPRVGSFTIVKTVDGSGKDLIPAGTTYEVKYAWAAGASWSAGGDTLVLVPNVSQTVKDVPAGATVTFTETPPVAVPGGTWSQPVFTPASVLIVNGETVSLGVHNTITEVKPTLQLKKVVGGEVVANTNWVLTGTATDSPTVTNANGGNTAVVTVNSGKTYSLSEAAKPDFGAADEFTAGPWACVTSTGKLTVTQTGTATASLAGLKAGQDVVCTIINTPKAAAGTIVKTVAPGYPTQNADGTWTIRYKLVATNSSAVSTYTYDLDDVLEFGNGISATAASVVTAPPGVTPVAGWTGLPGNTTLAQNVALTAAQHTHTWVMQVTATVDPSVEGGPVVECKSGEDPGAGGFLNNVSLFKAGARTPDDTDHACATPASPTVTKTAPAIAKQQADGTFTLTYTVTVSNDSAQQLWYSLTDTPLAPPANVTVTGWAIAGPANLNGGTFTAANPVWNGQSPGQVGTGTLTAGTSHVFTVTASANIQPGADPATFVCTESPTSGTGFWNTTIVTNNVGSDGDRACTTITPPSFSIEKSNPTVTQTAQLEWVLAYDVTVKNTGTTSAQFALTDLPQFGTNFTVVAGSESWAPAAPAALETLAGGASKTWTYSLKAVAAPGLGATALTCTGKPGNGFFNTATITFPGGPLSDSGCGVPVTPTVQKTAQTAKQDAVTGAWTLSYQVKVSNPSTTTSIGYSVTDAASTLPENVTGGAWSATGPVKVNGGDGTLVGGWNGSGALANGTLPALASHTYTVTRTVQIAASVPDSALVCGEISHPKSLWNTAAVTNGVGGNSSSDCPVIVRPKVTIDKKVTGTTQLVNGTWKVTYDVTVTNASTTLAATYDLSDDLDFGGDIVVTDASWTGPSALSPGTFALPAGTTTMATGQVLAKSGVDTYKVTAHATISAAAWLKTPTTLVCMTGDRPLAGGFLNAATVVANGQTQTDTDCATPELPKVAKTGVSAVQDAFDPDKWTVTYNVTVSAGKYDTFYDLSDTPAFPAGVTVVGDGSASLQPNGPSLVVEPGEKFVTDKALAAKAVDTYTVSWVVNVTDGFSADLGTCTGQPGHGFFNTATLTVGDVPQDGTACIPVTPRVYPTITKVVTSTTQKPDNGDWVIEYDVKVNLAAKGAGNPSGLSAKYSLTDTLDFGDDINIANASWTGPGASAGDFQGDNATFATNKTIAAGVTDTYHVRVVASVTKTAIDKGATACEAGPSPDAGGFLNTAQLKSGAQTTDADACSEPVFPDVFKSAVGQPVQNPETGLWSVTYDITVAYPDFDSDGPKPSVSYDLTDSPALPANVELSGDWTASAANDETPDPTTPTWNGTGTWTIVNGGVLDPDATDVTEHVFQVSAEVRVTAPPSGDPKTCDEEPGIVLVNTAEITSGEWVSDSEACQTVHYDDVSIVKTTDGVDGPVESDDTFEYVLTVTNNGTRPATDLSVTDPVPSRLTVTGLELPAGWINDNAPAFVGADNTVAFSAGSLGVGESVEFRLEISVNPLEVPSIPNLGPNDPAPTAPVLPESTLVNEACVAAEMDNDPTNDCDSVTVETKDIAAIVYTRCVADAPLIGFVVAKTANLSDLPVDFTWTPNSATPTTDPQSVEKSYAGGTTTVSDEFPWVGTAFTPSGVSLDYPGWRALQAGDYAPDGGFYLPGTTTVMTPEQEAEFVFNGLILDPSQLDYAWRDTTTVTLSVNPSQTFEVAYPEATPDCFVARHTEVQVEKTASVTKTEPGKSFTYDLAVQNVSDDAAADGVVVTDTIPADLKITNITWPGKGDAAVFPNWDSCAVAGQNGAGYGGTLTCELFGPLQPSGSGLGASNAPTITLSATVNAGSKSSVITNVGVVDYHTFGDPEDTGRDSDDAVVLLSALPATGGTPLYPLAALGLMALIAGIATIVFVRRRRGEPKLVR